MAYETIAAPANAAFIEKRSRFLSEIRPVTSREAAEEMIARCRARYWDATHNVYAYILRQGQAMRYSDDGEPQGTAGMPVLDVLKKERLTDVCVVVTRYFGGILLGGGGLVRAYSHSCALACAAADRVLMEDCLDMTVTLPYSCYGRVPALLEAHGVHLLDSAFGEAVTLSVTAPLCRLGAFEAALTESSGGKAVFVRGATRFFPVLQQTKEKNAKK